MRFLISPTYHAEMQRRADHSPDCFVRPGEYLHHLYIDGVKYVVAQALSDCLAEARTRSDIDAVRHLTLHYDQFQAIDGPKYLEKAKSDPELELLGDPPPDPDPEDA